MNCWITHSSIRYITYFVSFNKIQIIQHCFISYLVCKCIFSFMVSRGFSMGNSEFLYIITGFKGIFFISVTYPILQIGLRWKFSQTEIYTTEANLCPETIRFPVSVLIRVQARLIIKVLYHTLRREIQMSNVLYDIFYCSKVSSHTLNIKIQLSRT